MNKALFVCTGNTCRSPMAACLFNDMCASRGLNWRAESAGLYALDGSPASLHAREAMRLRGLSIDGHCARPVTRQLVDRSDIIVCVTPEHARLLIKRFPDCEARVVTLAPAVPDPFGGDASAYESAAESITLGLGALLRSDGFQHPNFS